MPAYDPKSRYLDVESYQVQDHRGRTVTVTAPAQAPPQTLAGVHLRRQGERPDHLAAQYLDDPMGFWRLAEANDAPVDVDGAHVIVTKQEWLKA